MGGLSRTEIDELAGVVTGNISDAMELLGIRRTVIVGFRFVAPVDTVVVGTAFTVRQAPKHHPAEKSERLVRHGEVADKLAEPGQVVVLDAGARMDVASWGENHSISCHTRGVSGLLINGCVRDASGIRTLGFPVFCLGFSPVKSQWDLETIAFNERVTIGSVQIRPGDIIFGDEDGVIVIPPEVKEEVFAKAKEIREKEIPGIPYLKGDR
jgi:regulator of RNase E activity RraA